MRRTLPLLLLLAAAPAHASGLALADGAYGPEPIGGGLKDPESVIRLAREHLKLEVGRQGTSVDATFTFVNTLPAETAHQLVGFPDVGAAAAEAARRKRETDAYDAAKPLEGAQTQVNGRPANAALKYGFVKPNPDGPGWDAGKNSDLLMAWAAVPVEFPSGKEVTVERRYRVAAGENVYGLTRFSYVTRNDGVWHGPVGKLEADVALVDGLTVLDLVWPGERIPANLGAGVYPADSVTMPAKSGWQIGDPTHLKLVWTQFEPRLERERAGFALAARSHP